jgi:membrane fusion protein, multidrug efflux system
MMSSPSIDPSNANNKSNKNNRTKMKLILGILLVGIILVTGYWFVFLRHRAVTDDAYVMAESARISSRVPGTVLRVLVDNDQPVQAGQVLVELDPRDYRIEVDRARAGLARVEATIRAAELNVPLTDTVTESQLQAAEAVVQGTMDKTQEIRHRLEELQQKRNAAQAELQHAQRDFERFENLFQQGAGSEQQRDRTRTALKKARAQVEAAEAEIAAARSALQALLQDVDRTRAQRQASQGDRRRVEIEQHKLAALKAERGELEARLAAAELNLSYCTIPAPISGYISQKNLQIGDRVQPGQLVMAVVPLGEVFVEANFKETQLRNVRLGQPASITADIYPGYTYRGKVAGIRSGTGAAFSLLPPENATGNWIKVVQRVPVKIRLNEPPPVDHPLRVGLSLEVTVHTVDRSGPTLVADSKQTQ